MIFFVIIATLIMCIYIYIYGAVGSKWFGFNKQNWKFFFAWMSCLYNDWVYFTDRLDFGVWILLLMLFSERTCVSEYSTVILWENEATVEVTVSRSCEVFQFLLWKRFLKKTSLLLPTKNFNHVKRLQSGPIKSVFM